MSGVTSSPAKAPKTMSSKLLTMKFMQRAAASSSPVSAPSTPDTPSLKRQRIDDPSPAQLDLSSNSDRSAIEAALTAEETKRQLALERQAAAAGDTHWVLTFKSDSGIPQIRGTATAINVVETGFAAIDRGMPTQLPSTDDQEMNLDRPLSIGRRSFGKFNRVIERFQDPTRPNSSESDSDESEEKKESGHDSEDSDEDDAMGTNALIKAAQAENIRKLTVERKKKKKAEKAELLRLAEKRKKKDINLNHLTSISGSGKGPSKTPGQDRTCFQCGRPGHVKADCPERGRNAGLDESGEMPVSKKVRKS